MVGALMFWVPGIMATRPREDALEVEATWLTLPVGGFIRGAATANRRMADAIIVVYDVM